MSWLRIACTVSLLMPCTTLFAQGDVAPAGGPDDSPVTETRTTSFGTGDWLSWEKMTGDWGGLRSQLADDGINFNLDYTNVFQGNAHGGKSTKNGFRISGKTDIELTLDTGKMGLWPGGQFILHAESDWGDGINQKVGNLIPVDFNAARVGSAEPGFGYDEGARFVFSEWIYQQVLFEGKLILIGGKLWGARAFDTNVFANDERTQFLNVAFRNNVIIPPFLPYTNLGVGAIVNPTPWLSILTAAADTDGRAKTTGFETTFHGDVDTTIIHEWAFKIKPFDLPGNQRVGFAWSCQDFQTLDPQEPFDSTGMLAINLLGLERAQKVLDSLASFGNAQDNIMVYYNFDQYLYVEPDDPKQGIGVFGRFGWGRQNVNPVAHFYTIGMGGTGILPNRDRDSFGVGYYYMDLSNDLPSIFHSEQGIECFYNIEVTPWLHIAPDLQVIVNPGGTDMQDVAVVYGLRMHMNF